MSVFHEAVKDYLEATLSSTTSPAPKAQASAALIPKFRIGESGISHSPFLISPFLLFGSSSRRLAPRRGCGLWHARGLRCGARGLRRGERGLLRARQGLGRHRQPAGTPRYDFRGLRQAPGRPSHRRPSQTRSLAGTLGDGRALAHEARNEAAEFCLMWGYEMLPHVLAQWIAARA